MNQNTKKQPLSINSQDFNTNSLHQGLPDNFSYVVDDEQQEAPRKEGYVDGQLSFKIRKTKNVDNIKSGIMSKIKSG